MADTNDTAEVIKELQGKPQVPIKGNTSDFLKKFSQQQSDEGKPSATNMGDPMLGFRKNNEEEPEHTGITESEITSDRSGKKKGFVERQIEENRKLKEELEKYKEQMKKEGISYVITRNDGERANEAVNELVFHLILSIVIIAVLLIFVLGWRESLIVTFTVPAILAITLFIAYITGQTVNRITLFAFLLSLGLLVDAAIIVIENIHRHFHSAHAADQDADELMIEATDEIGAPTNIATLAIILTMVPMAFVGQMMGQFMKPIPANVPVALIASLFVAYIFTPYLAVRLLKKPDHHAEVH